MRRCELCVRALSCVLSCASGVLVVFADKRWQTQLLAGSSPKCLLDDDDDDDDDAAVDD